MARRLPSSRDGVNSEKKTTSLAVKQPDLTQAELTGKFEGGKNESKQAFGRSVLLVCVWRNDPQRPKGSRNRWGHIFHVVPRNEHKPKQILVGG